MRKAVPVVLVAMLLLVSLSLAVGCGGDETATEGTQPPDAGVVVEPTTTTIAGAPKAFKHLIGTTLAVTDESPEKVRASIERRTPMVIAFYVTGGTDDAVVLKHLDDLAVRFAEIDFYKFDYKLPGEYGDLSALLEIDYPPQVTFVDDRGVIQAVTSGYADEGTLNQNLTNIR
ncbi:MAG: hypothetical protein KKA32_08245 [Actinobacteria bacterium]|nr:hypothetical protein [Actinomycetota bacterium]